MARRRRSREVEIFNFSFLDILACTIGLLIFIMVMVFILQSGSALADTDAVAAKKVEQASQLQAAADRDAAIADALSAQLGRSVLPPEQIDLILRRDAAQAARDKTQSQLTAARAAEANAESALASAKLAHDQSVAAVVARAEVELAAAQQKYDDAAAALARFKAQPQATVMLSQAKREGSSPSPAFQILHADCQRDRVVLIRSNAVNKLEVVGTTPVGDLGDDKSDFQRLLAANQRLDHPLLLLWVRPGASDTLDAVRKNIGSDTTFGFEPADPDWTFVGSATTH